MKSIPYSLLHIHCLVLLPEVYEAILVLRIVGSIKFYLETL